MVGNFYLLLMAALFGLQLFITPRPDRIVGTVPDNVRPSTWFASAYMGISLLVGQLAGAFA